MTARLTALDDIRHRINAAKQRAGFFVTQRRRDIDLYALLAECLAACEEAQRSGLESEVRAELATRPLNGRNRTYTEAGSDIFLVIGRYVFEPEINRAASWRYTAVIREAAKIGLASADLVDHLRANGGINALFRARPVVARSARTKTLHLNDPVEVPKDAPFTLTLRRDSRGFFDVVAL
jgi:hypothetical protein